MRTQLPYIHTISWGRRTSDPHFIKDDNINEIKMERTMNETFGPGVPAAKTGPETLQAIPAPAPAPVQKRRRPYERLTMTPIPLDQECALLQGSVTSNEVAVRNQVGVTTFDGDGTWSSDRFDVDFEL